MKAAYCICYNLKRLIIHAHLNLKIGDFNQQLSIFAANLSGVIVVMETQKGNSFALLQANQFNTDDKKSAASSQST